MIHWKYIKGLNEKASGNITTPLYTLIDFCEPGGSTTFEEAPIIRTRTDNVDVTQGVTEHDLGHMITQLASGQHIDVPFEFRDMTTFASEAIFASETHFNENMYWHQASGTNVDFNLIAEASGQDFSFDVHRGSYTGVKIKFLDCPPNASSIPLMEIDCDDKSVYINQKCQATYFNATSDKRAKTDLKPLSINALDLIKRVQLYSFKYKDSDLPSIGILAQDVQDINIEGFDLVDNKQASGIDMDYMSIHESKLTYILWKAIQEQQKEIEELKSKIK